MKITAYFAILTGIVGLVCCQDTTQPTCTAPQRVSAKGNCTATADALTLVASDFGTPAQPQQFTWNVYSFNDTLTTANLNEARQQTLSGSEEITLSPSALQSDNRVVVKVSVNCDGKVSTSMYFAFVKRFRAATSCYQWESQKI